MLRQRAAISVIRLSVGLSASAGWREKACTCLLFLLTCALLHAQSTPVPFISEPLVPTTASSGGTSFPLIVNGTGFAPTAVVNWNGIPRTTTFVSGSQVVASIPASDIAAPSTASISVVNPGGQTSNPVLFTIANPASAAVLAETDLPLSSSPSAISTADLNGNGSLDLVFTTSSQSGPGSVSVQLGNGDGTFQAPSSYAVGNAPVALAIGDFNGDGKPDVAVVNQADATVSLLLGNGDGTFQPQISYPTPAQPAAIVSGDLNLDGWLDLVVSCQDPQQSTGTIAVLLGNGDGTFQGYASYSAPTNLTAITLGDFNHDGFLDVAMSATAPGTVSVMLGSGDGSFQSPAGYNVGTNPLSILAADLNGDANLDLVAVDQGSNAISVLLGNGDGTFQTSADYPTGAGPSALAAGDFNSDGKLDVVVGNATDSTVAILLGNGDGTFRAASSYASTSIPSAIVVGDWNDDGGLDVASVSAINSTLSLFSQVPNLLLSSTNLTFGNQVVGTTGTQSVSLTNTGSVNLVVSGISILGANAADFSFSGATPPLALAPGGSTWLTVSFSPLSSGSRVANMSVITNAPNSVQGVALSGTGTPAPAPVVALSSSSLTFPAQQVGTTSVAQTVTLTNNGNAALNLSSIALTGSNSADFKQTNNCGTTIAAGGNCTLGITFAPLAAGSRTGILGISDNAGSAALSVAVIPAPVTLGTLETEQFTALLSGTTNPLVAWEVNGIPAGNSSVGTIDSSGLYTAPLQAPAPSSVAITAISQQDNTTSGTASLTVVSPDPLGTASGATIACPSGGLSGASCYALEVSCPGVADVPAYAKVNSPMNATSGTVIFLTGGGDSTLYEASPYGTTVLSSVLTNGFTAVQLSFGAPFNNLAPLGWFTGPGGPRRLACRFATAAQWIYTNIHQSSSTKPLCATGISGGSAAIAYAVAHYGLDSIFSMIEPTSGPPFARVDQGCVCNQPPMQTPCGQGALSLCYAGVAQQYLDPMYGSTACSSAQATQSTVNATMFLNDSVLSPDAKLHYPNTDVHFVFGGQDNTQAVPQGLEWQSAITSKSAYACVADAPHDVTTVKDGAIQIANDLIQYCRLQTAPAAAKIPPGPAVFGPAKATPSAPASTGLQTITLLGTGVSTTATLEPSILGFGNQQVNTTSAPRSVTLTNAGWVSLLNISVVTSAGFGQTNNCGATLAAGASCTISVTFTPTASGMHSGTLAVTDISTNSPQTSSLIGTGSLVALTPVSATYANQTDNTISPSKTFTLTNAQPVALTNLSISVTGPYTKISNCGTSLAAGTQCSISVAFAPLSPGKQTGTLSAAFSGATSLTASLTGTGISISLNPRALSFGTQLILSHTQKTVTITNASSTTALNIKGITVGGANASEFGQSDNCVSGPIPPAGSCVITVTFTPQAPGNRSASLAITNDGSLSPVTVPLTGVGTIVMRSPPALAFGMKKVGTKSSATVTVRNLSTTLALTVNSIAISGTNAFDFTQASDCVTRSPISPGGSCTITVTFAPKATGSRRATLGITDNGGGSPQNVGLSGTGT